MSLISKAGVDQSQRWWHLSTIQLSGGIISIPFILIGSQVYQSQGKFGALISVIVGNLIGLLLGYLFITMSGQKRLHAVENAKQFIGETAGRIMGLFVLLDMIGWMAIGLFNGEKYLQNFPFFSQFSAAPIMGAIGSLFLLGGIKGLKKISLLAFFPLLIFLISFYGAKKPSETFETGNQLFNLSGMSMILAASIAAIVDYPTFFRHSKSRKDSLIALVVIFIITSLVQITGIYLLSFSMSSHVIDSFVRIGISAVILIVFLIISMITTTAWNAYAASVGWESLFPVYKDKTEYAVIGLVATVLLSTKGIKQFIVSITLLSNVVISALGGVLIFYFLNKQISKKFSHKNNDIICANISWLTATIFGTCSYFNIFFVEGDSVIIGLVSGFIVSALLMQIRQVYRWFINR